MDKPEGTKAITPEGVETPAAQSQLPHRTPETGHQEVEPGPRWREVAAQAATESDPNRLSQLVDELIRLLDEERRNKTT
jgi:hypothetical protein